jgi:tol-pal system protein YbgF
MKLRNTVAALTFGALLLTPLTPAFAVSKEIVQLQTQVQNLSDQIQHLQQSNDERMGVLRNLVEQDTDTVNKMSLAVQQMQKILQSQATDTQGKVDQVSSQIQTLNDSVDEMKARFAKLQKQLEDQQQQLQNQQAAAAAAPPSAGVGGPTGQPTASTPAVQAPPPDALYNNAVRDYNAGRYDLAVQQFGDYLKYYPNTDLAGNAQFYVADVEYRQGNFEGAVKDYDKVIEEFPDGNKAAAAHLKKGFALLELSQRDAGVRELNGLINRYPRSQEAQAARDRLKKLGVTPGATSTRKR